MSDTINEVINDIVAATVKDNPEIDKEDMLRVMNEVFVDGKPFYETLNVEKDLIDYIYSIGYQSYQSGKYSDALQAFNLLRTLDPSNIDAILGKGLTFKEMKKYHQAIGEFYFYASIQLDDPYPYWYMYECFDALDDLCGVGSSLGAVIYICKETGEFDQLLAQAEIALDKVVSEELEIEETKKKVKKD